MGKLQCSGKHNIVKKCRKAQNFLGVVLWYWFCMANNIKKCIDIFQVYLDEVVNGWDEGGRGGIWSLEKMLTIGSMMKWWW